MLTSDLFEGLKGSENSKKKNGRTVNESADVCPVCGQTPCNCTHINVHAKKQSVTEDKDSSSQDYRKMMNFVQRQQLSGIPPEQQVAVALFKELEKTKAYNKQLDAELKAADQRLNLGAEQGEITSKELSKHRGELEKEKAAAAKQQAAFGSFEKSSAEREQASKQQLQTLAQRLEQLKMSPNVDAEAAAALEKQIADLEQRMQSTQGTGVAADKIAELEKAIAAVRQGNTIDAKSIEKLERQFKDAEAAAKAAQSKMGQVKDYQSQIEKLNAEINNLNATLSNTVNVKLDQLDQENEHVYQELQQHDQLINQVVNAVNAPNPNTQNVAAKTKQMVRQSPQQFQAAQSAQGVAEGEKSPMFKDAQKADSIRSLKNLIAIAREQGRQLRVQELELELKKLQGVAEGNGTYVAKDPEGQGSWKAAGFERGRWWAQHSSTRETKHFETKHKRDIFIKAQKKVDTQSVAEGVTSPEIKQAYNDIMKTQPGTPERKAAVRKYLKLRADALERSKQGVAEGLPQTLRKVVPGYAKREIDRKMDAGKFGKTDADKDANFYRYKKIQDKLKDQGVAEEVKTGITQIDKDVDLIDKLNEAVTSIQLADMLFKGLESRFPEIIRRYGHEVVADAVMDVAEENQTVHSMNEVSMLIDDVFEKIQNYVGDQEVEEDADSKSHPTTSDLELIQTQQYAGQHYPQYKDNPEKALQKYILRSLKHSEEDDKYQDQEIQNIEMDVAKIKAELGINETRMYYNVISTPATNLRKDFGMRKDSFGWFLTEASGPKNIMEAQRAFGAPKLIC